MVQKNITKKLKKYNEGITLISLVVTIVILLILAGITVASLTGENGLIGKASEAKNSKAESDAKEEIEVEVLQSFNKRGDINREVLNTKLARINGLKFNGNALSEANKITEMPAIVELDGFKFLINEDGDVSLLVVIDDKNYIGYYADIDTDGIVDGIIFADLVAGSSKQTQEYGNNGNGTYQMPKASKIDGFKNYYVSKNSYTWGEITNPVLSPTGMGNDRFYIMSLTDFTTNSYTAFYWYKTGAGNMKDISITTSVDFGAGKTNTQNVIDRWNDKAYGDQNAQDIWGNILSKVSDKWFVPSRGEWAAFTNELNIENNVIYGLNTNYWTSSQRASNSIWYLGFNEGDFGGTNVSYNYYDCRLRLARTF